MAESHDSHVQVMRLGKLCTQLDEVMIIEAPRSVGTMGTMGKSWENHGKTMGQW